MAYQGQDFGDGPIMVPTGMHPKGNGRRSAFGVLDTRATGNDYNWAPVDNSFAQDRQGKVYGFEATEDIRRSQALPDRCSAPAHASWANAYYRVPPHLRASNTPNFDNPYDELAAVGHHRGRWCSPIGGEFGTIRPKDDRYRAREPNNQHMYQAMQSHTYYLDGDDYGRPGAFRNILGARAISGQELPGARWRREQLEEDLRLRDVQGNF